MDSSLDHATWVLAGITFLLVIANCVTVFYAAWARNKDIELRVDERKKDETERADERAKDQEARELLLSKVETMAQQYIKEAVQLVEVTRRYTDQTKRLADENQAMVTEMAETRHSNQLP